MQTEPTTFIRIDDLNGNWRIKFLTSGSFTPLVAMNIDAFLLGGGTGGNVGGTGTATNSGGGGGGSGGIPGIAGSNGVSGSIVTGPTCIWPLIVIPEVTSTGGDGGLGSSSAATAGKPGVGPGAGGGGGGAYSNAGGAGTVARCYIIEFYC